MAVQDKAPVGAEAQLDEARLNSFLEMVLRDWGAISSAPLVMIGDRLGLYDALAAAGPLTPAELAVSQPAGTVTGTRLTIGNTGTAALQWSISEAALSTVDDARQDLLREGVLLVPNTGLPGVAAFDPETGKFTDALGSLNAFFGDSNKSIGNSTLKANPYVDHDYLVLSNKYNR